VLIESNQKKSQFLQQLIALLKLENVQVLTDRAELIVKNFRETFDIVCARAVIKLSLLLEITIPYVTINGYFIAYQGLTTNQEIEYLKEKAEKLGSKLNVNEILHINTNYGTRTLFFFKKEKLTPLRYPRKYSQIMKK
jgi:16S rRNA (guanine527-N7)-methyltransferase